MDFVKKNSGLVGGDDDGSGAVVWDILVLSVSKTQRKSWILF